ncbi:MAG: hypothetical protein AABN33_05960 [Acidobacteriota bacterium]
MFEANRVSNVIDELGLAHGHLALISLSQEEFGQVLISLIAPFESI